MLESMSFEGQGAELQIIIIIFLNLFCSVLVDSNLLGLGLDNRWTHSTPSLLALVPYSVINSVFKAKCRKAAPSPPPRGAEPKN